MDLNILGVTMTSASIRLTIPPARIRDVQKLLSLEAAGFIPDGHTHYDSDEQAFVLELDGDAVSQVLDLLTIAIDDRESETWQERKDRSLAQLKLNLGQGIDVTTFGGEEKFIFVDEHASGDERAA